MALNLDTALAIYRSIADKVMAEGPNTEKGPEDPVTFNSGPVTFEQGVSEGEDLTVVDMVAVGDLMVHKNMLLGHQSGSSYNFDPIFDEARGLIGSADVAFGNLEVNLGREDCATGQGDCDFQGFPYFRAPESFLKAIVNSGIDVVNTANNHTLDHGYPGVEETISVLDEYNMPHVGTASSSDEQDNFPILEVKGAKIAFLGYTDKMNKGGTCPESKDHCVNRLSLDLLARQIRIAKERGADFIVVSVHWGNEYQSANDRQREMAKEIFSLGTDIILGHHSHVPQEMERMVVNGEEKFVIYSLGNFVHGMTGERATERNKILRNISLVAQIRLGKNAKTGKTHIMDVVLVPFILDRDSVDNNSGDDDVNTAKSFQLVGLSAILSGLYSYSISPSEYNEAVQALTYLTDPETGYPTTNIDLSLWLFNMFRNIAQKVSE